MLWCATIQDQFGTAITPQFTIDLILANSYRFKLIK